MAKEKLYRKNCFPYTAVVEVPSLSWNMPHISLVKQSTRHMTGGGAINNKIIQASGISTTEHVNMTVTHTQIHYLYYCKHPSNLELKRVLSTPGTL